MSKERYKQNRDEVFTIYGIDPNDRRFNCHHICDKHGYKKGDYGEDFDINGKANLIPLKLEDHDKLHRRIQEIEGQIKKYSKKNDRKQRENPTPRRIKKKSKRKRGRVRYRI